MASSRLSKLALVLLLVALGAAAQVPTRVRGKITAIEGDMITVDQKTHVHLGDKTEIVFTQPIALADIKPGETIFSGARVGDDGKYMTQRVAVSKDGVKPPQ